MKPTKLVLSYGKLKVLVALTAEDEDGYLFHTLAYESNPEAYADIETAICHFQEGGLTSGLIASDLDNSVVSFNFSE